ncbi:hypothetical protein TrispH2_008247 [Trichoplax sp. H2]|nr:hypothetical protein TrispH2_008247 [Trichoplax sp. H2]|eukprot:RDD39625.1 hypothetical protein TrispH2_008247 [Trichoplax sp. H2]
MEALHKEALRRQRTAEIRAYIKEKQGAGVSINKSNQQPVRPGTDESVTGGPMNRKFTVSVVYRMIECF